ncbi:hypothetical protein D3C78_1553470 [compost metagenome]
MGAGRNMEAGRLAGADAGDELAVDGKGHEAAGAEEAGVAFHRQLRAVRRRLLVGEQALFGHRLHLVAGHG